MAQAVIPRVIVHLDMDCFYAQVERERLKLDPSLPLGVIQWDGLIAVNYPARAFGVKRGDRSAVALAKCPGIRLVHVEYIGGIASDSLDSGANDCRNKNSQTENESAAGDRACQKVSLARYRAASQAVFAVFARHCARVERASVDEAYLDLTRESQAHWEKLAAAAAGLGNGGGGGEAAAAAAAAAAVRPWHAAPGEVRTEEDGPVAPGSLLGGGGAHGRLLLAGADLVSKIRRDIKEELNFTVSAGISHSKIISKLVSARNKPNKQTLAPLGRAGALLAALPLGEVRGLGGKLGARVRRWAGGAGAVADLQKFTEVSLVQQFGEKTGKWLFQICRGIDNDPVVPNLKPKSLLCFKSFSPLGTAGEAGYWLRTLARELAGRLAEDRARHRRRPTALVMHHRGALNNDHKQKWVENRTSELTSTISKSMPIQGGGKRSLDYEALIGAAHSFFEKFGDARLPCTRLALGATDFVDLPKTGKGSISNYFGRENTTNGQNDHDEKPSIIVPHDAATVTRSVGNCRMAIVPANDEKKRQKIQQQAPAESRQHYPPAQSKISSTAATTMERLYCDIISPSMQLKEEHEHQPSSPMLSRSAPCKRQRPTSWGLGQQDIPAPAPAALGTLAVSDSPRSVGMQSSHPPHQPVAAAPVEEADHIQVEARAAMATSAARPSPTAPASLQRPPSPPCLLPAPRPGLLPPPSSLAPAPCPRCGEGFPAAFLQDHLDFHLARDLAEGEEEEEGGEGQGGGARGTEDRRRAGPGGRRSSLLLCGEPPPAAAAAAADRLGEGAGRTPAVAGSSSGTVSGGGGGIGRKTKINSSSNDTSNNNNNYSKKGSNGEKNNKKKLKKQQQQALSSSSSKITSYFSINDS